MKLNPAQRETLRMKFGGRCAYCGVELQEKGWHADHVEPVWREWWKRKPKEHWDVVNGRPVRVVEKQKVGMGVPARDVIGNLLPSCRSCNIDKAVNSLEDWRKIIANKVAVLRRNYSAFNHAERFGLVKVINGPVVFWFERFTENRETIGEGPREGKICRRR